MRGKDETVFGDSRDRFVAEVLDHLERISLLQRHLGVARSCRSTLSGRGEKFRSSGRVPDRPDEGNSEAGSRG